MRQAEAVDSRQLDESRTAAGLLAAATDHQEIASRALGIKK